MAKESLPGLALFLCGMGQDVAQDHSSALNAHDSNYNGFGGGLISIFSFFPQSLFLTAVSLGW